MKFLKWLFFNKMKKNKILYLSYDGLLEPLGESQILSYQYKIANKYNVIIVSFEKRKDLQNITKLNLLKNNLKEKNYLELRIILK